MNMALEVSGANTEFSHAVACSSAIILDLQSRLPVTEQISVDVRESSRQAAPREDTHQLRYLLESLRQGDHKIDNRDLLYLFLTHLVATQVAKESSADLLERFGSLGNLLAAPWHRLEEADGRITGLADAIKTVYAICVGILREPVVDRPLIGCPTDLHNYLKVSMGHLCVETCRVLFLDKNNGLIRDELHSRGTIDHVMLDSREIVRRAMELRAHGIILVHNHPSGDLTPSEHDIRESLKLNQLLKGLGVFLQDHVIVGGNSCISFRNLGLL